MTGAPPLITEISRPWWDALATHRLALQNCRRCAGWVFYPRPFCPHCGGRDLIWRQVEGAAVLYTFSVAETPVAPQFAHLRRPILAVAALPIGVHLPTTLVDVAPEQVRIGMQLEPFFDHATYQDVTLLRYRPAR